MSDRTSHGDDERQPIRIALYLPSGVVIDVPPDVAARILDSEATVQRKARKWTAKIGHGGRLIRIDGDLVARILDGWPEIAS